MKRRVLIFSLAYYPSHVSGTEAAIREITDRIAPLDIEFELVTLWFDRAQSRDERVGNVLVHRIGIGPQYLSKILFIPMAALRAKRIHKERPLDGLWAMMTYMLFPVVVVRMLGLKLPYVLTLQDGDPYEKVFERWFIKPLTPLLDQGFKQATVVQAISRYLAEWPKRRGAEAPVELIHNGGNPNDFNPDLFLKEELREARAAIGLKETDVLIGNTARLVRQKGWEDMIVALTKLPEHVKLLVVGGGPDEAKYKALVAEHGLEDRVIFAGHVDRSEVTKYRRMLDIFVMPSRSEGLGNAGLSAMASRIPVVATQVGGLAEYIFDAKRDPGRKPTAWAVDPDSPGQIAAAVQHILERPDEARIVVENANDMVTRHYQWDAIARDMREKVFSRLCAT